MEEAEFYDFDSNDISNSETENTDFTELQPFKEKILLEIKEEISLLKSEIISENGDLSQEEKQSESIKWQDIDNSHIWFDFNWEMYELNKFSTKENWEWFDTNLSFIKNRVVITDDWNFVINDWNIYDWDKAADFYTRNIDRLFWYSDRIRIHNFLENHLFTGNQKYDFENFAKNKNFLSSLVFLWEAKNTKDSDLKNEYIAQAIECYNSSCKDSTKIDDIHPYSVEELMNIVLMG